MGVACSTHGEMIHAFYILIRNSEPEKPFGRPRSRWKDNTAKDLTEG